MVFDSEGETWLRCWLPQREAQILEVLWSWPPRKSGYPLFEVITRVLDEIPEEIAYTTLASTVARMMKKGLIQKLSGQNQPVFILPTMSEEEFYRSRLLPVLTRLQSEAPESLRERGSHVYR